MNARHGDLAIGLGVLAVAVLLGWQVALIDVNPAYSRIGPRIFPIAICAALAAVGLLLSLDAFKPRAEPQQQNDDVPTDFRAIGFLVAGLVAQIVLLKPAGFIFSSSVMFVLAAVGFGSRRYLRDIAAGLILSTVIFFGFTRGLSIELPAGLLSGVL